MDLLFLMGEFNLSGSEMATLCGCFFQVNDLTMFLKVVILFASHKLNSHDMDNSLFFKGIFSPIVANHRI